MSTAVVAFSGGLDTSFIVPFIREKYGFTKVVTCTVNTGGFSAEEAAKIAARSKEIGADEHYFLDGQEQFYVSVVKYLIYGNVSRDGYPLCVGAERMIQGKLALEICQKVGATHFVHGSTGAGNDQYRFDLVVQVLGKGSVKVLAPVREFNFSREFETKFLQDKGITVSEKTTNYSYNPGLWGVSIGGKETHASTTLLPSDAWYAQPSPNAGREEVTIAFEKGVLTSVSTSSGEKAQGGVASIQLITKLGNERAIGRNYHIGTSIPGKKGRIGYESPAADIIYAAHRTLEKITLTQAQIHLKASLANEYGKMLHEAKFFDPAFCDIEAFLTSSQSRVTGTATVVIDQFRIVGITVDSPFNLLSVKGATYGEGASAWTGEQAEGACLVAGFEQAVWARVAG